LPVKFRTNHGVAAEHEEVALGEVDDVQHTEEQGQARCHQRERRADDEAVQRLQEDLFSHQCVLVEPRERARCASAKTS